jgi:hypothetical protein
MDSVLTAAFEIFYEVHERRMTTPGGPKTNLVDEDFSKAPEPEPPMVVCSFCDGRGTGCFDCNHEDGHECEECRGIGKLPLLWEWPGRLLPSAMLPCPVPKPGSELPESCEETELRKALEASRSMPILDALKTVLGLMSTPTCLCGHAVKGRHERGKCKDCPCTNLIPSPDR